MPMGRVEFAMTVALVSPPCRDSWWRLYAHRARSRLKSRLHNLKLDVGTTPNTVIPFGCWPRVCARVCVCVCVCVPLMLPYPYRSWKPCWRQRDRTYPWEGRGGNPHMPQQRMFHARCRRGGWLL